VKVSLDVVVVVALLFEAGLAAQEPKITLTREIYPTDTEYWIGDERWLTARVVDAFTRAPLPGAEMLLVAESNHPLRGEFWFQMRAVADADGFVRIRADQAAPGFQPWNWVLVRADGHGGAMAFQMHDDVVVALAPAETVPVRLVDWLDRPVADALVGLCAGCGHTPDLAHARTDANGVAVLQGVDFHSGIRELYVEHPDLHLGYDEFDWFPGEPPIQFRVMPGVKSVGVVVDPAGKPIAGAYVGSPEVHRGPWTRTAADGSFRLYGAEQADDLFVHHGAQRVIFGRPAQQPFRLQLPPPDGEREQIVELPPGPPPPDDEVPVSLTIVGEKDRPIEGGRYRCIGPLPARDESVLVQRNRDVRTFLQPGRYELRADCDDYAESLEHIEVTAEGRNDFTVRPTPLPSVLVRAEGLPPDGTVELRTIRRTRDMTDEVREGRRIGVPDEPFWFLLHGASGGQRRLFATDRQKALAAAPIRLPWFQPTRVVGQVVDAEGEPMHAEVAVVPARGNLTSFDPHEATDAVATRGAFSIPTEDEGLAFVVVRYRQRFVRPRVVPVILPPRGDDVRADIGTIVLGGPARLQLQKANGEPFGGDDLGFMRRGWHDVREGAPRFPVDGDGCWCGPDPLAGDTIVLPGRTAEPDPTEPTSRAVVDLAVHFLLTGDGPWTLQVPAGELLLDARSTKGETTSLYATIGGALVGIDGPTLLRRLQPGPQRLFVAAKGHQSAIVDVVVPTTGRAKVTVELPPR